MTDTIALTDLPPDDPDFVPCGVEDSAARAANQFGVDAVSSTQHPLTRLLEFFDKWGVNYRTVAGYETRGRPASSGGYDPRGVQWHHTGSTSSASNPAPSLRTLTEGRPDLTGPLCAVAPDYNGVVWVVALGRANHAGLARAHGALPAGDGNALRVGFEIQTSGLQVIPPAQMDSTILATVAVLDMLGVRSDQVADYLARHYDTSTTGKWDVGAGTGAYVPLDIRPHARTIAALLAAGPQKGPLMALTDAQQNELLENSREAVRQITAVNSEEDGRYTVATGRMNELRNALARLGLQNAALTAALAALSKDPGITPALVTAAAEAGAAAALDQRITDADVTLNVNDPTATP